MGVKYSDRLPLFKSGLCNREGEAVSGGGSENRESRMRVAAPLLFPLPASRFSIPLVRRPLDRHLVSIQQSRGHFDLREGFGLREVSEISSQLQEVLGLVEGSLGDVEKPRLLGRRFAPEALNNVRGNGRRGSSELGSQSELFIGWKPARQTIDLQDQAMSFLPDVQIVGSARRCSPLCLCLDVLCGSHAC